MRTPTTKRKITKTATQRRADHRRQERARRQRMEERLRAAERCVARGRLRDAIRHYRRIVDDHPDDLASLNRIGDLLVRTRHIEEAMRIFRRVAVAYARDGFAAKAMAICTKILRWHPDHTEARDLLVDLSQSRGLPVPVIG